MFPSTLVSHLQSNKQAGKAIESVFSPAVYEFNFKRVARRGSFGWLKIWKSMRAIRVFYWKFN